MTGRQKTGGFDEDLSKTPGAARYPVVDPSKYRRRAPSYSMLSRRYMPGDKTDKPGPVRITLKVSSFICARRPSTVCLDAIPSISHRSSFQTTKYECVDIDDITNKCQTSR